MTTKQKTSTEVQKIQSILGKNQPQEAYSDAALDYDMEEKCTAIFNWSSNVGINFDMAMVESIHKKVKRYGSPTHNQQRAINNIITQFKIDVSKWSY